MYVNFSLEHSKHSMTPNKPQLIVEDLNNSKSAGMQNTKHDWNKSLRLKRQNKVGNICIDCWTEIQGFFLFFFFLLSVLHFQTFIKKDHCASW